MLLCANKRIHYRCVTVLFAGNVSAFILTTTVTSLTFLCTLSASVVVVVAAAATGWVRNGGCLGRNSIMHFNRTR